MHLTLILQYSIKAVVVPSSLNCSCVSNFENTCILTVVLITAVGVSEDLELVKL